jgi:hypothetical protein
MCDSQMLADFFTSDAVLDKAARTCLELSVTLKLSQKDMACKDSLNGSNLMLLLMNILAKFRSSIIVNVPNIINLFKDRDENIRKAATNTFLELAEHGKSKFTNCISLLTSIVAEFRPLIGKAIPQIIDLLKDGDVRMVVTNTLSKLAEYSKRMEL